MSIATKSTLLPITLAIAVTLSACQAPNPPAESPATPTPQVTPDTSERPARSTDVPTADEPAKPVVAPSLFVDKVWKVKTSTAVEPGTTYTFLGDGTLVIDSPNGTPLHGKWTFENDALTLIEDGIPYLADVLRVDADEFHIRSHNPGEPVEIVMVPAPEQPLPASTPKE